MFPSQEASDPRVIIRKKINAKRDKSKKAGELKRKLQIRQVPILFPYHRVYSDVIQDKKSGDSVKGKENEPSVTQPPKKKKKVEAK